VVGGYLRYWGVRPSGADLIRDHTTKRERREDEVARKRGDDNAYNQQVLGEKEG